MRKFIIGLALLSLFVSGFAQKKVSLIVPEIIVQGIDFDIIINYDRADSNSTVFLNSVPQNFEIDPNGQILISYASTEKESLIVQVNNEKAHIEINPIPQWLSIIPPMLAILLALLFKEVISSLFIGILSGTLIISFYAKGFSGLLSGFLQTIDTYAINAINSWSHIAVIVFSMFIAAVVSIISKNGGMRGVVNRLEPYAKNPKSGQLVIWFMGILIFFDDYANTLVVGNTMRPVADRLKISREKLAYLVDSTAAPVAAIAFVTTWIGAELGYIESGLSHLPEVTESPYGVFLQSLKYAFYPIFTLAFMLMLIFKGKDFGPMLQFEKNARNAAEDKSFSGESVESEFTSKEGVNPLAFNAIIPILVIIIGAIVGMLVTGYHSTDLVSISQESAFRKLSIVIGNSDSYKALVWSSFSGVVVAVIMTISQRIMKLEETIESGIAGFKTMIPAMVILISAWSLAGITEDMQTAVFLQGLWSDSFSPVFVPAVVFIISGLVSFSTGSSWGTMAILYPLLLPASYHIAIEGGLSHEEAMIIFYNVVSVVLAGSVFGDHCSPISDTTILSSLATSCNHLNHVKTQMPYALTVGVVAIVIGSIPAAMGVSSFITMPLGLMVLYGVVHFYGKPTDG